MGVKVTNNAFGTISAGINTSATTIVLDGGQGARFPTLGSGDFFFGTLIDTSNNLEIVKVTARSTDSMTVTRAQDNTTARAFAIGDRFELRPTAALFESFAQATGGVITSTQTFDTTSEEAAIFDRSDNGTITSFKRNGTEVATIAVDSTDNISIGATTNGGAGFHLFGAGGANPFILPMEEGALADNLVTLGDNARRFKDIYLGGGAYIGGTSSVNHLDDYEEGTWTPQHNNTFVEGCWNNSSSMSGSGYYTKVGNMVTCWWDGTVGGGSGNISVSSNYSVTYASLPFAPAASGQVHKVLSGYQMIYSSVGSGHIGHGSITPLAGQSVFVVTTTAVSNTAMAHNAQQTLLIHYRV